MRDLNALYRDEPALHARDAEAAGFSWVVGDDQTNSVFAFLRQAPGAAPVLVVCNLTPVPRHGYRVGAPAGGVWREIANTDSRFYGGSDLGNDGAVRVLPEPAHGQPKSLLLTLPPLATIFLRGDA